MFKRYPKHPFDKENTASTYDAENQNVSRSNTTNSSTHERSSTTPYTPSANLDKYSQETLPRIYSSTNNPTYERSHEPSPSTDLFNNPNIWKPDTYTQSSTATEEPETTLGEGVSFKGELRFHKLLRIDGVFEGSLISEGKLIVGPKGVVKSNIVMREAIVEGKVEGNIQVKERVELRGEAQVYGDITAKSLSVDEGVSIVGQVMVTPHEETLVKD